MKITYLDNSGFAVQLGGDLLIFDYYNLYGRGGGSTLADGVVDEAALRAAGRVYIFASHSHGDHYSRGIYALPAQNATYLLSDDIIDAPAHLRVRRLAPGQSFEDGHIRVLAHPSTDLGVSFQVEIGGLTLFHAGDLNCWHWAQECPPEEEQSYRDAFAAALEAIRPHMDRPDVAFFPVDPRMRGPYDNGAVIFAQAFQPRLLVPMHMQGHFEVARALAAKLPRQRIFFIEKRGDQLVL